MEPADNSLEQSFDSSPYNSSLESPSAAAIPASARRSRLSPFRLNRLALSVTGMAVLVIGVIAVGTVVLSALHKNNGTQSSQQPSSQYAVSSLSLNGIKADNLQVGEADHLAVNGQLKVSNTVVLTPTGQPTTPELGQIYYDKTNNAPYYYDGSAFVSLAPQAFPQHVTAVGGAAGTIALGNGLQITGNKLAVANSLLQAVASLGAGSGRVTSLQGLNGDVNLVAGTGIGISTAGNNITIANNGITGFSSCDATFNTCTTTSSGNVSIASSDNSITITALGNGQYDLSAVQGGPGATAVVIGPAGSQSDTTDNTSININKPAGNNTSNFLSFDNAGNPVFVIDQNGQITSGSIPYTSVTGRPATTVTLIGSDSGAITVGTGLSESGGTLSNSGVTSLSGTLHQVSVSAATGNIVLSLPQNVDITSTPTFGGETLNGTLAITAGGETVAGGLTVSSGGASITGNSSVTGTFGVTGVTTLNGNTSVSGSNTFTVGTGLTTLNGGLSVSGASTFNGSLSVTGANGFTTGTGTITLGSLTNGGNGGIVQSNGSGVLSSNNLNLGTSPYITGTLGITNGGTGSGTAAGARGNLGAAASGANNDITSLTGLTTALSVSEGGTGVGTLTANGILFGNGTGAIQATSALANAILATNGSSIPGLTQTLPAAVQGNITSTGALASGSIASGFGTISTGNNITTTAALQGGSLNIASGNFTVDASGNVLAKGSATIQGAGGLTIGVASSLAGSLVFANASNNHLTTLQGLAPAGQDQTITIPASSGAADTVCLLSLANCAGAGGGVTATGYSQNYITKFTGVSNQISVSQLFDNGTSVGIGTATPNASYKLDVAGGIQTSGNFNQTGASSFTTGSGAVTLNGATSIAGTNTFSVGTGASTLGGTLGVTGLSTLSGGASIAGLTVTAGATINGNTNIATTSGNTAIGTAGATFSLLSSGLNVTAAGALTGVTTLTASGALTVATSGNSINGLVINSGALSSVTGITSSGNYTQSGSGANTFTGATTIQNTLAVQGSSLTIGVPGPSGTTGNLSLANASNGNLTTIQSLAPSGSGAATVQIPSLTGGNSYQFCISGVNCGAAANTITGSSAGTTNFIPKYSGNYTLQNSGISDDGTTVTVASGESLSADTISTTLIQSSGALSITPGGTLTIGASNQILALQGSTSSTIVAGSGVNKTTVDFTTPTGSRTVHFPDESGTICLQNSSNCGFAVGGSGVTSLDLLAGALTINNTSGLGTAITIDNASTGAKGIAEFNASDFSVVAGVVDTIQPITTTSAVTFGSVTLGAGGNLTLSATGKVVTNEVDNLAGVAMISLNVGVGGQNIQFENQGGANSFLFPTTGGTGQVICTSGITCASGGGQAVILEPGTGSGTAQTASANRPSIWINKSAGSGDIIELQAGGSDAFLVDSSGNTTIHGTTTIDALQTNSITPTAALTVGAAAQTFTLQGDDGSLTFANGSATSGYTGSAINYYDGVTGFKTVVGSARKTGNTDPTGDVGYYFENDSNVTPGNYFICTEAGNCAGVGGGVTTAGGTAGTVPVFTTGSAIGDSIITASSTLATVNGSLSVGSGANQQLAIGSAGNTTATLQFTFNNGTSDEAVTIAGPSTLSSLSAPVTVHLPTTSGTFAVGATGPLSLDATTGVISCATCLTGGGGGSGGVTGITGTHSGSVAISGSLTINNALTSGSAITIDDASTTVKGIAKFNSTNFTDNGSGTINTVQDIATTSSPQFTNLSLNGATGLTLGDHSTNTGHIVFEDGTTDSGNNYKNTFTQATLTGNQTVTVPNASGTLAVSASGNLSLSALGNLTITATPSFTSVTAGTINGSSGLTIDPSGGALTAGNVGQSFTLQGTSASTITAKSGTFTSTVGFVSPTANRAINFPDVGGTICTDAGNCLGATGGANAHLSNLSSVAINTTLLPGAAGTVDLGSGTLPFGQLYIAGTSGTPATNNFLITGVATAARTITLPDATGTVCLNGSAACGFEATTGTDFIKNQTAQQTAANFNIQARASSVAAVIQGDSSTDDILDLVSGSTSLVVAKIDSNGNLTAVGGTFSGNLTGGTYNGQTISSTANFTGTVTVASGLTLTGSGSFPGSPTAGELYYNTGTNQLYVYNGTNWTSDKKTATEIVAASNSTNKNGADFIGNGTADDVAINAAISALPSTGGSIVLLDGTFNISSAIAVGKGNVTITGQGANTILNRTFDGDSIIKYTANNEAVYNLSIAGNKATYTSSLDTGITFTGGSSGGLIASGLTITNTAGDSIVGETGNAGTVDQITNNVITGAGGFGIKNLLPNSNVSGNTITGSTTAGISSTAANVTISGNYIASDVIGVQVYGDSNTVTGNTITGNTTYGITTRNSYENFSNNTISSNGTGIAVDGRFTANYLTIESNQIVSNTGDGIFFSSSVAGASTNDTVSGNNVSSNGSNGIDVQGVCSPASCGANNYTISNNQVYNNGGSGGFSGITITIGGSGVVQNNQIIGNQITDTTGTGYAINIGTGVSGTYLSNNNYSGTGASSINDQGTGTVYANQVDSSGNIVLKATGSTTIQATSASTVAAIIQGAASQTANLLQLQDNSGNVNAAFNSTGNQLTLGRVASSGTVTQGKLVFADGTTDNRSVTLQVANQTVGNGTVNFPNLAGTSDTVCFLTLANCVGTGGGVSATGYSQNFITKFNGTTNQITTSQLFDNGTNVGINLSSGFGTVARFTVNSGNADNAAAVQFNTGADANKGLVIQAHSATQSADLFQIQASSTGVEAAFAADGTLRIGTGSGGAGITVAGSGQPAIFAQRATTGNIFVVQGPSGTIATIDDTSLNLATGPINGRLNLLPAGTAGTGITIQNNSGQTGDLLQLRDSSGRAIGGITPGSQLYLGAPTASGAIQGSLKLYAGSDSSWITINGTAEGVNTPVISFPSSIGATDTFCLLTLGNCAGAGGSVTTTGGTQNFITKYNNAGATQISNSQLFDNGTNVGVNLSSGFGTVARFTINANVTADNGAIAQINTGADSNKGLVIQNHSAGQSADLLELQNSSGTPLAKFDSNGFLTINNTTGISSAALSITSHTNAVGAISINNGGNGYGLQVTGGFGFSVTGGNVITGNAINPGLTISTGGSAAIGQIIQGASGQTADLLQLQDSSSNPTFRVEAGGTKLSFGTASSRAFISAGGGNLDRLTISSGATFTIAGSGGSLISGTASQSNCSGCSWQFLNSNASDVALAVQAAASQTADLLQVQSSSGQTLAGFNASGNLIVNMTPPATPSISTSTLGGTLAANTYYYKITGVDAYGNETNPTAEVSITTTGSTSTVTLNSYRNFGTVNYRIYRGTSSGGENVYFTANSGPFVDTGTAGTAGSPPTANTARYDYLTSTGVALGGGSISNNESPVAIGLNSVASNNDAVAFSGGTASGSSSFAFDGTATADRAIAINGTANGSASIALGTSAVTGAGASNAIALGLVVTNNIQRSLAFGSNNGGGAPTLYARGGLAGVQAGTVSTTAGLNTVTGVGTSFTTDTIVGDTVTIGTETYVVTAITDNTHMTLSSNFINTNSGVAWTLTPALFKLQNSGGGAVLFESSGGNLGLGTTNPGARLHVVTSSASSIGQIIQASASQTADLLQLQDSSGAVMTAFAADGSIKFPGITGTPTLSASTYSSIGTISVSGALSVVAGPILEGTGSSQASLSTSGLSLNNGSLSLTSFGNGTSTPYQFATSNGLRSGTLVVGSNGPSVPVDAFVGSNAAGSVATIIQGASSQTADLFELQDNNGNINAAFNGAGNQLTLGRVASGGTVTQGKLVLSDGTTSNKALTLQVADGVTSLSNNISIRFPANDTNATDTVCLLTLANCVGTGGGVTTTGGTQNFITKYNNAGATQVTNSQLFDNGTNVGLNVNSGFGTVARLTVNANVTADNSAVVQINTLADANKGLVIQGHSGTQSGDLVEFQASTGGTPLSKVDSNGKFFGPSFDTVSAAGTLGIGNTNAGTINIGNTANNSVISIKSGTGNLQIGNDGVAKAITVGNTTGNTSILLQTGTGNLSLQTQGSGVLGIGTNAVAQTITIGNTTGATGVTLQAGSSGITLTGVAAASNDSFLCLSGTNVVSGCNTTGNGAPFVNGGNNFGGNAVIGTSSASQTLAVETAGTQRLIVDTSATTNFTFQQASNLTTLAGSTTAAISLLTGNASAGAAGNISVDTGTFTSGTPTINIGTGNATNINIGNVTNTTNVAIKTKGTSSTAFTVQNASSVAVLTADTSANQVLFGVAGTLTGTLVVANSAGGTVTLTTQGATTSYTLQLPTAVGSTGQCLALGTVAGTVAPLTYASCGTAQHSKSIVLTPEYSGAALDSASDTGGTVNCNTNNSGTMTSGWDNTQKTNYYQWTSTQASEQCYDIIVQIPVPSDWSVWASTTPITVQMNASSTTNTHYAFQVLNTSGTAETSTTYGSQGTFGATGWAGISPVTLASTSTGYSAGGVMTLKIRVQAKSSATVQVGSITLNYTSQW